MYEKLNIIFEEVICEVHVIFQPPVDVQRKERRNVYIALWSFEQNKSKEWPGWFS